MQLHGANNHVESNIKGRSRGFAIEASHKAFKILSDSLYKDKITASIRELSTNAHDAHIEAGNDEPFIVHLPTPLEPYFSVTDHGVGMGQEEVATLYTTYFSSSKTDSNDVIGALGLGSKSPFSYTESFNIEAIKDGHKGIYTCFISSDGMPTVQLIEEVDTDERNGVSISFAVRENDFDAFITKAARVYWAFDHRPTITGATTRFAEATKWYDELKIVSEGDGWMLYEALPRHLRSSFTSRAQLKMGNILYPINEQIVENHLDKKEQFVLRNNFIINAPLGACDIAPSREELNYDEETIAAIIKLLDDTFEGFSSSIVEAAGQQDTAWKAICRVTDALQEVNSVPEFTITYEGKEFTVGDRLEVQDLSTRALVVATERTRSRVTLVNKVGGQFGQRSLKVTPSSAVRFVQCSRDNQMTSYHHRSRIRHFIQSNEAVERVVLLAPGATAADLEKFGNPDVIHFDNLPKVPRQSSGPKVGRGVQPAYTWKDHTSIDVAKLGARKQRTPFVVLKNQAYYPIVNGELGEKYDRNEVGDKIRRFVQANVLDTEKLIVVPYMTWKNRKSVFTTANKWFTIEDYVAPKITKSIQSIRAEYEQYQHSSSLLNRYDFLVRNLDVFEAEQFSENSLFRTFLDWASNSAQVTTDARDLENQMDNLIRAAQLTRDRKLQTLIKGLRGGENSVTDQFNLAARYPMLALISESWELRRGGMNRYTFNANGGVKSREENETSVAEAVTQYIKLIDQAA